MTHAFFARGPQVDCEQLIKLRHLADSITLFPARHSRSQYNGGYRSRFRGRGMDFEEVRLYQPGDDVRTIDWRVTARTAKTHTKIFREEKDRPIIIAVDQGATMFFGSQVTFKSVMAAQCAALLAWAGLKQNDKIGGIVFNEHAHHETRPLRNKNAVLKLLETITEFNHQLFKQKNEATINSPATKSTFTQMLEKLRHIARPGTAVFLVSDFASFDEDAERLLYLIKRHTDIYAVIIADPLEKALPLRGNYTVTDGEHKLRFNSGDTALAAHYKNAFDTRIAKLEASFDKLKIGRVTVWTGDDPRQKILELTGQ